MAPWNHGTLRPAGIEAPPAAAIGRHRAALGRRRGKAERNKFCAGFAESSQAPVEKVLPFDERPMHVLEEPEVPYIQVNGPIELETLMATPLPKGASQFSSLHLVAAADAEARLEAERLRRCAAAAGVRANGYDWPELDVEDLLGEFSALFRIASDIILSGADRASLLVFICSKDGGEHELAVATLLAMLPFRGIQAAVVTQQGYRDPLGCIRTSSGLFEYNAAQPQRLGRRPLAAIYGPLPARVYARPHEAWTPIRPEPAADERPAPFKIGGLDLPMVTFEGPYHEGVVRLARLLLQHFGPGMFPVVSVGEICDQLGYGWDIHHALVDLGIRGHYFVHPSGESFKCPEAYRDAQLLAVIASAKRSGQRVVVVAVGGGANGNAAGMLAALMGADFVEVPTTIMHYNDATTSAKKAFSLVVDGQILSKNILGTFYLPKLVFCISEAFLTLTPSSVFAAAGEAAKTMSMLGRASSSQARLNFHNILGAGEFASDFTRIAASVAGFERLLDFLRRTADLKAKACSAGRDRRNLCQAEAEARLVERSALLQQLRDAFRSSQTSETERREVTAFLTIINEEVIRAKAMFLAYSDPFEKYRALLFEYAHTLGHGLEAFMNGLYRRAEALHIDSSEAFRLHGQCVGMAVLWAGEMSRKLGHLEGDGYLAHQALVALFNRSGGFDFKPLRQLCDRLGVSADEFCDGVLQVVRRDNKRGYCRCSEGSSVDQLVRLRPGILVQSGDPSAELRYLVEVAEDIQRWVLGRAFAGDFDQVLVSAPSGLVLISRDSHTRGTVEESVAEARLAAMALDELLSRLYAEPQT